MQARNEGGSYQVVVEGGNGQILEIFCKQNQRILMMDYMWDMGRTEVQN